MAELNSALPLIYRITEESKKIVKSLQNSIKSIKDINKLKAAELEEQVQTEIKTWETKMEKLGGHPKGVFLVDFDNGSGYFCWRFPEVSIKFHHGYQEGFTSRVEISQRDEVEL